MCDKRHHEISNEKIFISSFSQYEFVRKIYSNPNDRSLFNEIFKLCFRGHSCLRHKIDLAIANSIQEVTTCSYYKVTGRCEISFNNQLICSFKSVDFFWVYVHQLIHAYLYLSSSCSHDIDEASDHGYKFDAHMDRIMYIFDDIGSGEYNGVDYVCYGGERDLFYYCKLRRNLILDYWQTMRDNMIRAENSRKKSLVCSCNNAAKVPNKTAPTNVQSTNRKIVTNNPKTPSISQKQSSVPTNKKNTVNVPKKTVSKNVQSTNKNIATKKPLQVNANTVSTIVTKSSVPTNENNTAGSSTTSGIFPITTTLTNNQGDKIVSIAATKQSTVIVIHHD